METILEVKNITKEYKVKKNSIFEKSKPKKAVHEVNIKIKKGETVGITGDTGAGKTTLSEIMGDLQRPDSGTVEYYGKNIGDLTKTDYRIFRKNIQFIFQNPRKALNPYYSMEEVLIDPLRIMRRNFKPIKAMDDIINILQKVQLDESILGKYPWELSSIQAIKIFLARALLLEPEIIICDDCIFRLNSIEQAHILDLLKELQEDCNISYLMISRDMEMVNFVSDYSYILKDGRIVYLL